MPFPTKPSPFILTGDQYYDKHSLVTPHVAGVSIFSSFSLCTHQILSKTLSHLQKLSGTLQLWTVSFAKKRLGTELGDGFVMSCGTIIFSWVWRGQKDCGFFVFVYKKGDSTSSWSFSVLSKMLHFHYTVFALLASTWLHLPRTRVIFYYTWVPSQCGWGRHSRATWNSTTDHNIETTLDQGVGLFVAIPCL